MKLFIIMSGIKEIFLKLIACTSASLVVNGGMDGGMIKGMNEGVNEGTNFHLKE